MGWRIRMRKQPKLKLRGLVTGEQVVMHTCREAAKYPDKVWTTRSEPWDLWGTEVIMLEGFSGRGWRGLCTRIYRMC